MQVGAAYIRVSTEDQLEFSPDSQLKKLYEYAESHSISLKDEFIYSDEGISGRSAQNRPQFLRMMAAAKTKPRPFDVILVWKFSRFARNRQDSIFYKSMLRKECGIEVISITEPLSDDPTSILVEALLEAMDEYYSLNLAQEVRRGMAERFSRGGAISVPPFGYVMKDGRFVPQADNAQAVRLIYTSFLGGATLRQIAVRLNTLGIRTKRGNLFDSRAVEYILTNPTYTGKLRRASLLHESANRCYRGANVELVVGEHEPIISEEIFDSVQVLLTRHRQAHSTYSRDEPAQFMLRGLVRCSSCGATLTPTADRQALQCYRYARGQCIQSHSVSLRRLNEAVLEKLGADLLHFRIQAAPKPVDFIKEMPAILASRARQSLRRAHAAYVAGIDTLEDYRNTKEALLRELAQMDRRNISDCGVMPSLNISAERLIAALGSVRLNEALKNRILSSFVSEIILYCPEREFEIHYHI